jgi:L-threonylcarbamoyladenylate synthase
MKRVVVDPQAIDPDGMARAAGAVREGLVVAFPTDTLYGLAADPFSPAAVARLCAAKGRPEGRALPLVAADGEQVERQLGRLSPQGARLAARFWPGPLTLLMDAPEGLAPDVTAGTGRVGVRVPDHPVARALCAVSGLVLTATSANRSGAPPFVDAQALWDSLVLEVDLVLDGGPSPGGPPSTVVDVTGVAPRLVRAGVVSWDEILECLAR